MTTNVIESLQSHVKKIQNGEHESVHPGQPARFTEACQAGDGIWQGDLGLELVDKVPDGYAKVDHKERNMQLVPGNTQGSRHCLDSLSGVEVYLPQNFNEESLQGPCLVLSKERTVLHPTHGPVTLLANSIILCRYQREWDKELQKQRRQQD